MGKQDYSLVLATFSPHLLTFPSFSLPRPLACPATCMMEPSSLCLCYCKASAWLGAPLPPNNHPEFSQKRLISIGHPPGPPLSCSCPSQDLDSSSLGLLRTSRCMQALSPGLDVPSGSPIHPNSHPGYHHPGLSHQTLPPKATSASRPLNSLGST